MKRIRAPFGLLLLCASLSTACAFGTTPIPIAHSPFEGSPPSATRADLVVRVFADERPLDRRGFIGAKRNGYGMVLGHLGVEDGQKLDLLLTRYFAEALAQAGYRVAIQDDPESQAPADFAPVGFLEGVIENFWLDMYMATWHKVDVLVRLKDRSDSVLWEGRFDGEESNVLWIGISAEFEQVIREALDKALAKAVAEFGSDDFAAQVDAAAATTAAPNAEPSPAPSAAPGEGVTATPE